MKVSIEQSKVNGTITPPSSKSVAHRALVCAFLSGEPCEFFGNFNVGDIKTTLDCLTCLGAKFQEDETEHHLLYLGNDKVEKAVLNVKDSGSTFRFLVAVTCALGIPCEFKGEERLANRPISELLDVLIEHGCSFSSETLPFSTSGKLTPGNYVIDGNVSSQFITGLLLALPNLQGESTIRIKGEVVSADYLKITESVMSDFGVSVEKKHNGYNIKSGMKFHSPKTMNVEGDWSSACFFLALGAICGKVTLRGLDENSFQGDKTFLNVLEEMGAKVERTEKEITIKKEKLNAIEFDAQNYPDVVPILSAVASVSHGETKIYHVERLKQKESNRLFEILKMLKEFGITAIYNGECIRILGGRPVATNYVSPGDHRMAMASAVLACATNGVSSVDNAECVEKSYPEFFKELKKVGGKISV